MAESQWSESDRGTFRRIQVLTTAALLLTFAAVSALQANMFAAAGDVVPGAELSRAPVRFLANLAGSAVLLGGISTLPFFRFSWVRGAFALVVLGLGGAAVRALVLVATGVHRGDEPIPALLDSVLPAATTVVALGAGYVIARVSTQLRYEHRESLQQQLRASEALEALEREELDARRRLAEGLHSTLQQRLVVVEAMLGRAQKALASEADTSRALGEITDAVEELDSIRENDVRGYSQLLYPAGAELGLAQAIRILFRRLSKGIAVDLVIDPSVVAADDPAELQLDISTRVLAVRVLEEGISNALRHGRAGSFAVRATVEDTVLLLEMRDDGRSASESSNSWSGLERLSARLEARGGGLELRRDEARGHGHVLRARLPLSAL